MPWRSSMTGPSVTSEWWKKGPNNASSRRKTLLPACPRFLVHVLCHPHVHGGQSIRSLWLQCLERRVGSCRGQGPRILRGGQPSSNTAPPLNYPWWDSRQDNGLCLDPGSYSEDLAGQIWRYCRPQGVLCPRTQDFWIWPLCSGPYGRDHGLHGALAALEGRTQRSWN